MGGYTRPFYHYSIARSFQVTYTVLWVSDEADILMVQEDRFDSQPPRAVILLGTRYGLVVWTKDNTVVRPATTTRLGELWGQRMWRCCLVSGERFDSKLLRTVVYLNTVVGTATTTAWCVVVVVSEDVKMFFSIRSEILIATSCVQL